MNASSGFAELAARRLIERVIETYGSMETDPDVSEAAALLMAWDGKFDATSRAPTWFAGWSERMNVLLQTGVGVALRVAGAPRNAVAADELSMEQVQAAYLALACSDSAECPGLAAACELGTVNYLRSLDLGAPIQHRQAARADTLDVTERVDEALDVLSPSLADREMTIHRDLFRQADFIENAVSNLMTVLRDGAILVIVVLFLFLWSVRPTGLDGARSTRRVWSLERTRSRRLGVGCSWRSRGAYG